MKGRVVVGMSGGVDSSVAAYLLKEQGYEVIGATMKIWQNDEMAAVDDGGCCGLSAVEDARRICDKLDIPYYVLNFKADFKEKVIEPFINEYINGRTPNPCISCNKYVKWESMLNKALELGADFIATGHYARVVKHPETGRYTLKKSVTDKKDQTYALYNLNQHQLEKTLMPVGEYEKDAIRDIASKIDISVANKPDSQEICFIPDDDYSKFITDNSDYKNKKGDFVDSKGNILGQHLGIINYTVGQRKGLGIALGKPVFVLKIDVEKNQVVLGDDKETYSDTVYFDNINWMAYDYVDENKDYYAKIRYSHKPAKCRIKWVDDVLCCVFYDMQRAFTKGQALVVYDDDYVVFGGVICS